jgi:hypothetical protein
LTGDKVKIVVEVATSMGPHVTLQEFLVMDHDGEDLVMGVQWHTMLVGGNRAGISRIVDVNTFGVPAPNPLDSSQDEAPEDLLLDTSELEVFPEAIQEGMEQCHFNEDFPKLDKLKEIVANHGSVLFQPFDQQGLKVDPLQLKVHPLASFRMQPCRYVKPSILGPLKALIDQFVSENVLISIANLQVLWLSFIKRMVGFVWQSITERSTSSS